MLRLENISLSLVEDNRKVDVLKDINLELDKKKIYVMTGPNGGGKSSIAKAVMGMYTPSSGKIFLDSQDITNKNITERARMGIGYAFQNPARFKGMQVKDMLTLAAGTSRKPDLCELLFDVGLCAQDYLDREINASFSGGELKRLEIASILARDLKVALFDEPEAGIDLWSFQRLTETFETLNDKYDTTIVIISHQERILKLADQVILVSGGKISEITDREKILGEIRDLDTGCRCRNACEIGGKAIGIECDR